MRKEKSFLLLLLLALAVLWWYFNNNKDKNRLCHQEYALCTSAPCIPDPNDHSKAICFCDVEKGPSMSTTPCSQLEPETDSNGIRTVYSTFSLKQANEGFKPMQCPSDTPWTWCLNKKCTVDPSNPKRAICSCDVKRDQGEWTTFGGQGNTSTCSDTYWSGAPIQAAQSGRKFLQKAFRQNDIH